MSDEDRLKRFEILNKLIEAGMKNFTFHKGEVQDGHLVCLVLMVEDKEVKITK